MKREKNCLVQVEKDIGGGCGRTIRLDLDGRRRRAEKKGKAGQVDYIHMIISYV
jgi:uncharacterized protein Veg